MLDKCQEDLIDDLRSRASNVNRVFIDFDGVVIDSEPLQYQCYAACLHEYGFTFTQEEFLGSYLGNSELVNWNKLRDHFGLDVTAEELTAQRYDILMAALLAPSVTANWFIAPLIQWCHEKGIVPEILSANQTKIIEAVCDHVGLADLKQHIYSLHEITPQISKPELIDQLTGGDASRCLIIEDSASTLEQATKRNMFSIGVRHSFNRHKQLDADIFVNSD